jgi:hypothetical protein
MRIVMRKYIIITAIALSLNSVAFAFDVDEYNNQMRQYAYDRTQAMNEAIDSYEIDQQEARITELENRLAEKENKE